MSTGSIAVPSKAAVAPPHARNTFVRSAATVTARQPLAKSREERGCRQIIMKRPLVFDVLLLRMLSPHIDAQAPPAGLPVNMHSTYERPQLRRCRSRRVFVAVVAAVVSDAAATGSSQRLPSSRRFWKISLHHSWCGWARSEEGMRASLKAVLLRLTRG